MHRDLTNGDQTLIKTFQDLLAKEEKEQIYQTFLEKTPRLIPQEFIQNHGVHFCLIFRKLRLAENYITDFLYLSKSSGDWNVIFVEIEKPQSRYFSNSSDSFHPDFQQALEQVNSWRAWTSVQANVNHLLSETLEPIWQPRTMRSNPVYVKHVLVFGRRAEFECDDRKRNLIRSQERDDFKILSYDNLADGYQSNQNVYIAQRSNTHIDIISDDFFDEGVFCWISPDRLRISSTLRDDAIAHRDSWSHYSDADFKTPTMENVLQRIAIRPVAESIQQGRI